MAGDGGQARASNNGIASFDPGAARPMRTAALARSVASVRLVSDERAALLGRLGVQTVADELYNVPRRYLDFSNVVPVALATVGEDVTVVVTVDRVEVKRPKPKMVVVEVDCYDETGVVVASYFGQPWVAQQFRRGQRVALSGKMGFSYGFKRMNGPFHDLVSEGGEGPAARPHAPVLPVHRSLDGLSQQWARRIASCALEDYGDVCDFWPARLRAERSLMPLARALRCVHFPADLDEAE